jgi:hypothetical protein
MISYEFIHSGDISGRFSLIYNGNGTSWNCYCSFVAVDRASYDNTVYAVSI